MPKDKTIDITYLHAPNPTSSRETKLDGSFITCSNGIKPHVGASQTSCKRQKRIPVPLTPSAKKRQRRLSNRTKPNSPRLKNAFISFRSYMQSLVFTWYGQQSAVPKLTYCGIVEREYRRFEKAKKRRNGKVGRFSKTGGIGDINEFIKNDSNNSNDNKIGSWGGGQTKENATTSFSAIASDVSKLYGTNTNILGLEQLPAALLECVLWSIERARFKKI